AHRAHRAHRRDDAQCRRRKVKLNRDRPHLNRDSPYFSLAVFVVLSLLCLAAIAQSGKVYRIGLLETTSATTNRANLEELLRGLKEAGYVEGKNLVLDYRSADGRPDRFAEMAADLVRARPDV